MMRPFFGSMIRTFRVITHAPAKADIDVLQVNGFGFGGQDGCLILTRA